MPTLESHHPLREDIDTLREVSAGLERLEQAVVGGHLAIRVRRRGYFTPDDDDRARQLLLAYRNYRLTLYDLIRRHEHYAVAAGLDAQLRRLLVGLAAGLTLYSKSLRLIAAYEHEPLVRQKLNEPEPKFDLPAGFFDEVIRGYSSLRNYRAIARGLRFWRTHLRAIDRLRREHGGDWAWLCDTIRRQRTAMRCRLAQVLWCRVRFDWRELWRAAWRPLRLAQRGLQSRVAEAVTGARLTRHYAPALDAMALCTVHAHLRPGDVLLIRHEQKLTTALLPGFWTHAALYVGRPSALAALDLTTHPVVSRHLRATDADASPLGDVIEAISPRVQLSPLPRALHADHVAVFRPRLAPEELRGALFEAFGHLGKPYDYEFDFNVSNRIVCTELIYRCFHRRAGCEFPLVKRLGRFTLTGDDLASRFGHWLDRSAQADAAPFRLELVALKLRDGRAHFFHQAAARHALRRIEHGWRPGRIAPAARIGELAHA